MTQLVKHYYINRDTGAWATNIRFGLMVPNIEHLNVQYRLEDENNVPFMLSHVPDYVESVLTINLDELLNYKSEPDPTLESLINSYNTDHNLDIINYEERTYEEQIIDERSFEPTGETRPVRVCDITYKDPYILTESEGLFILTEEQWNSEISTYDIRQKNKRYDILRVNRDKMLEYTDWMVIRAQESNIGLSTDFATWRAELRDLPNNVGFPTSYPILPSSLENDSHLLELTSNFSEVRSTPMINDPLPPFPEQELPG
jgi:hypothetical protein